MHGILTEEIKKLSVSERILLVEELWDSIIFDEQFPELTEVQRVELNKRIDSYHENPSQGRIWDEIKDEFWKAK
ncbi:MAG: addiction module protein [bacterium]|nr:addiction module protein [bacterium]